MEQIQVLELLIKNMKTQQRNMDYVVDVTNERIIEALNDTSTLGKLEKKDIIQSLLNNERHCIAKSIAYQEVQGWAEAMLQEETEKKNAPGHKDINWFENQIDKYGHEKGSHIPIISVKNLLNQMKKSGKLAEE